MPKSSNLPSSPCTVLSRGCLSFCGGVLLVLAWLAFGAAQAQTTNYALGTTALLLGPAAGSNTVVLGVTPQVATWTNTANDSWLHLSPANQSGAGSTNVLFTYDANPGPVRSGSLTIVGQTVAITQAGLNYVAATAVGTLVSSGLKSPFGIAVDGAGNIYIADAGDSAVKEWSAAIGALASLVSTNLSSPGGVAVDTAGNVYIADTDDSAIKEWMVADSNVVALISSGLSFPEDVALDGTGNVYIADSSDGAAKEWTLANSNLTTLVSGLSIPYSLTVDAAGNVYVADTYSGVGIVDWTAADNTSIDLPGGPAPYGVAVDGSGNVYIAEYVGEIQKWTAANGNFTTLVSSGLNATHGVAVDGAGNVYISDTGNNAIKVLPYAFLDTTPRLEGLSAGTDSLPAVVPATANLLAPFTATSDQSWLTITNITNGIVGFAFTATPSNRTAYIHYLGQIVPVTQGGPSYSLGASALLVGPSAGSNSVVLAVAPYFAAWTNTANVSWLHLSVANQSGAGSANVIFSYDANSDATRSGTLTIAGQTLTVTEAGSTYVQAPGPVTTVVGTGVFRPAGVAVDSAGNLYIADTFAVKEWTVVNDALITIVPSGLASPNGVAVDGAGNVYIADTGNGAIKEWTVANSNVTTLVSSGLNSPQGVAVDSAGNVYIADTGDHAVKEWSAANSNVTTLVSAGLDNPTGVAVDRADNIYIADYSLNAAIKKWTPVNGTVTTLVTVDFAYSVAVDGEGNIYTVNFVGNPVSKWTAANSNVTTLVSSGFLAPSGVAVDGTGNIYMADTGHNLIKELPYAFVDPTPKSEGLTAGNDSLPMVLPATENLLAPFAPTSDQSWLTISSVTNDVVSFAFAYNLGTNRTADITLLGQSISVTQSGAGVTPPNLTGALILSNGVFQFSFTNTTNGSFTVFSTTNLSFPLSNWTMVGTATNTAPGQFQFTSQPTTNDSQRFYQVRSP
jgi:sugar lactone lactonase YvrE